MFPGAEFDRRVDMEPEYPPGKWEVPKSWNYVEALLCTKDNRAKIKPEIDKYRKTVDSAGNPILVRRSSIIVRGASRWVPVKYVSRPHKGTVRQAVISVDPLKSLPVTLLEALRVGWYSSLEERRLWMERARSDAWEERDCPTRADVQNVWEDRLGESSMDPR